MEDTVTQPPSPVTAAIEASETEIGFYIDFHRAFMRSVKDVPGAKLDWTETAERNPLKWPRLLNAASDASLAMEGVATLDCTLREIAELFERLPNMSAEQRTTALDFLDEEISGERHDYPTGILGELEMLTSYAKDMLAHVRAWRAGADLYDVPAQSNETSTGSEPVSPPVRLGGSAADA